MDAMLLVSQASNGAPSSRRCSTAGAASRNPSSKSRHPLSSSQFLAPHSTNHGKRLHLTFAADDEPGPSTRTTFPPFATQEDDTVFAGDVGVPLEGVIQFDKISARPRLLSWAILGLLGGGDMLCLLAFSALGRFSHGLPVFDFETFKTADPFIAGWVLSAYFLGGYGDDGKGFNGYGRALAAAARSWLIGIPLGIIIRSVMSAHIPQPTFVLIAMGSTWVLLLGWRALICKLLTGESNQNDVYRRGNSFELFELLTSLVRRW